MNFNMLVKGKSIHFNKAAQEFSLSQDTINSVSNLQVSDSTKVNTDSGSIIPAVPIQEIQLSEIDSILLKSEERERQIELERLEQQRIAAQRAYYRRPKDTTEILYNQFGIAGFPVSEKLESDPFNHNFLYNFNSYKPNETAIKEDVFIEQEPSVYSEMSEKEVVKPISPEYINGNFKLDWITILLAASLLILGWVRLFNKKYLLSLVKSIFSYQEANTLLREKNSLMERASFLLNTLFISNSAVFAVQLKRYYNLSFENFNDHILYLIIFGSLLVLYVFRALSSGFIAYLFLKQKVFGEYFHNLNIYTKITGLFLFPVIISIQFLTINYLNIFIYLGISIIIFAYFLLFIRAFQIFIRKNVSIFYMILYLCAFEISTFLIIYKLLFTLR